MPPGVLRVCVTFSNPSYAAAYARENLTQFLGILRLDRRGPTRLGAGEQIEIMQALPGVVAPDSAPTLVQLIRDADKTVNKHVAGVPPWIWLSSGVNAALCAVGPGAADTVIAAVSDADPFVRQWAVAALEGLRYPAAASALVHSVREDPDPAVRSRALRTLASTYAEHPDALATLEFVASHDSVRSVQKTATKLLKKAHRSK